jgi:hypothetical protein
MDGAQLKARQYLFADSVDAENVRAGRIGRNYMPPM